MLLEARVEFAVGDAADGAEFVFHGGGLDEVDKVAARGDGDDDLADGDAEKVAVGFVVAGAVNEIVAAVILTDEGDDEVDGRGFGEGGDAEDGGDVDDADAADFHVFAGEVGGAADEAAVGVAPEAGEVVGDQGVAALDEAEGGLAFAKAGLAFDEDAEAGDLEEGGVDFGGGGGELFEEEGGGVGEVDRLDFGGEDGQGVFFGEAEDFGEDGLAPGEDEAGHFEVEEAGKEVATRGFFEGLEVFVFGEADELDAAVGKAGVESGKGEPGTVEEGLLDDAMEPLPPGENLETEFVAGGADEVGDRDLGQDARGGGDAG